ncbi:MAG: hemolysin family protein [Verrucomicrobia bacterium]|nr:hemolysin family protein [Verrucomicrobiota bacterium]
MTFASVEVTRVWDLTATDTLWHAGVVLFFILLNAFFVAAEYSIVKVRDSQLQERIDQGDRSALFTRTISQNLEGYLPASQLGVTFTSIALGWVGEPYLAHMIQPLLFSAGIQSDAVLHGVALTIAYLMITYLHVVLGEQLPKVFAIRNALPTALLLARPLHLFYVVFKPAIWLLRHSTDFLLRRVFGIQPVGSTEHAHSEEELKHIVSESETADEVTETEKRIVLNALALNDRYVRDVMTPRNDVIWLDVDEPFEKNLKIALDSKHTRFPLVEGHLDHSIGLIHVKDLLRLVNEDRTDLRSIKRDILTVPEMMPGDRLLKLFLDKHAHLALAVDEFGGAVGIVTLDNVVEELVGDIQDEFDVAEKPEFRQISTEEFEVEGGLNLYEINQMTDLQLESDEVTTIGGYVTHLLGHFPKPGEKFRIANYEVTATKVEARRVAQLHFRRVSGMEDSGDAGPTQIGSARD